MTDASPRPGNPSTGPSTPDSGAQPGAEPWSPPTPADPEEAAMQELAGRLFDAARRGDAALLAAYVDAGVPVDLANERGDTLVMLAAYHGGVEAVRALLARGADPDRPNDRGQTPLAGAVFKKEPDVVRALVDAGADVHAGTPSAAQTAAMFGTQQMLDGPGRD